MERGGTTTESVATPRQRTETSKGSDFRKELILKDVNCSFRILKAKTGRLKKLLLENTEVSTVRKDYSEWMVLFEAYLNQHDIYCGLLSLSEVEEYNHEIYENRDIYICNFRCHIQEWLRQAESDVDSHISKGSKTSRHSRSSRHSVSSSISSLKLQEENKKIELTARANALKEKHKLDKARLDIEHREEQLEIDTELQISSEKSNLLKNLSNDDNKSVRSTTSVKEVVLTPSVEPTDERTPAVEPVLSVQTEPAVKYVPSDESAQFSASLARHLRKPATNIKSFSGDVLNYHKFIRQFKSLVISNCESFDEKMTFLEQFTTGEAYRFVSSCSYKKSSEEAYTSAMRLLEERYGDKEVVANAFVNRALKWPEIRSDNPKALDDFVLFLTECSNAIESIESEKHLDFAETVRIILRKLPYSIQDKYRTLKDSNRGKSTPLKFVDLLNLLQTESRKANDPMFGKLALISERRISERRPFTVKPKGSYATQFSSSASGNKNNRDGSCGTNNKFTPFTSKNGTQNVDIAFTKPCAYCNHPSHRMDCCRELSSLSYEKKSDFVRSKRLCFGCLKIGHVGHFCKNNPRCELCSRPHHTVLHPTNTSNNNTYNRTDKPAVTGAISNMSIADEDTSGNCAMAIIPVVAKLKNGLNTVCTYAFLDPGSSISFCSTNLIRRLAGHGKKLSLTIDTMGTPHTFTSQVIKGIQISDLTQENVIDLPIVYTKDEMPVTKRHIPTNQEIQRWPHLRDISLPIINSEIELLIGNNVPDVYSITDFRNGPSGSPNAVKSPLGWIIWNLMRDGIPESTAVVNRATISSIQDYEEINTMVTKMYNYDFPEAIKNDKRENSQEAEQFLDQVNKSISYADGHYTIALPFKAGSNLLPNNMYQAVQRLQSLATKMRRNPEFACDYTEFMEKLITDGHAEVVPENEIERPDGKVWYLPHHGVYHAKKNKIRVVFDCAATYQGSSLNNRLLQGPDLTNNLIGVLLRFRQGIYAAQGDIQSMFYMVNVPRSDTDYLRFLWWPDGNVKKGPAIYRMLKHSFGLRSSPSCANSALRRTALDNVMNFDELVFKTVLNNFYVDDCLRSHDDKDQLMKLVKDLRVLCSKGGFRLSKWISNDREILSSVPVEDRAKNVVELNLDYEELPVERALGITWNVESDVLKFDVALKPQPYTRRGILATIGSVYDPLGLVSPFLLAAKLILQNLCRLELGWDDQIPETDLRKWQLFLESLPGLERFDIPRCYKPKNFGRIISSQIHSFADASTEGYGMVAYLRFVNESEDIYCSLLFGKARVAPLKKMTIPRMELTAATIAVRLTNMVLRELEIHVDQVFYHTDSMSVLRYLRNTSSRFLTFVANRIAVIRDGSDISQWYYVDTKNNPADQASRGVKADNLNQVKKWFHGPDFLWKPNYEWPEQKDLSPMLPEDDPELRIVCSTTADTSITDQLLSRFSSWDKLRRVVARLLICFEILRGRVRRRLNSTCTLDAVPQQTNITKQFDQPNSSADGFLTPEDIEKAESAIIRYTQYQHYNRELRTLSQHDTKATVNKNSTLRRLDPILVNGNLRVGGRLNRADIPYDEKHPLILPAQTHVSMLIVRHVHTVVGHLGKSAIMAELRQKYWIVRASSLIKSVISKCVSCRKYKARVAEQKMADLPVERLIPDQPPFSRVGMDFFGPFEVKRGRSTIKRYGVIFTCLAVRAVHLEVAYSLDTDSCISSIRRFISRRGPVKFIRSDNGTNLIGSERELREEIQDWNQAKIKNTLLQYGINWQFNPPAASHFGGVWERLIRTVRRILYALLKERLIPMDDEALHTFLCEVEAIMNCRPITTVSSDMNDINPLTPNHLLLNRSGETMPIGIFDKADNYARRRWRQIQYLSGIFWKRWTREYLQLLQVRQKWLKPHKNVAVGDVVLVVDTTIKCSYTLGRVIEVIADRNGLVRVATVKTQNSTVQRPVHKLSIVLEAD